MPPNWDEGSWDSSTWDSPSIPIFQPLPTKPRKRNTHIMASNPTPDDDDVVCALAEDLADGCHLHEVSINIKQNTEAVIRAAITATQAAKMALATARVTRDSKHDLLLAADAAGTAVLKNCRLRNVKLFGTGFNASWDAAGWPGQSTSIPDSQNLRFTLLMAQKNYFTANPTAESVDMEATAALCAAAHTAVSDARQELNTAETNITTQKAVYKTAIQTLRKRVRGLIDELDTLLADDDARYTAFGLNIPATPVAPEAIATLTLTAQGGGKLHAEWPYSTRMGGTRLVKKIVGVDDDFSSAGTTDGLEKTLSGFAPGVTVQMKAIAYNDGGDAPPSPMVSVVVT